MISLCNLAIDLNLIRASRSVFSAYQSILTGSAVTIFKCMKKVDIFIQKNLEMICCWKVEMVQKQEFECLKQSLLDV